MSTESRPDTYAFLGSGGALAALIRAFDWERTALGPIEHWSLPLRTLVGVMLGSAQPMFLAWGELRTLIYNDAYADVLKNKHPALGKDFLEVWREIRNELEPLVIRAYRGEASHGEDIELLMYRKGYFEKTHWAYSYTPVHDKHGAIAGFFCPCHEITGQVLAKRRQALLIDIGHALSSADRPQDAMRTAVTLLGQYLGANRVGYAEVQSDDVTVVLHSCYADGVSTLEGSYRLDSFGLQSISRQQAGLTQWSSDILSDPELDPAVWTAIDTRSYASVPLVRDGRFVASLYVNFSAPHQWTPEEIQLIELVAARTWGEVERAKAESRLRDSEERLRELNETLEARVAEEVAERAKAEEALLQAQKMEVVGQLTGGIAHDFNNMLAIVVGSLDMLKRRMTGAPVDAVSARHLRLVQNALEGASKASTLVHRLLAFSRQQALVPQVIDVNKLVSGMSELLRRTLTESIIIETVLSAGLWRSHADPGQLENAILNLAVNARDAMPEGGRLTVETANTHLDENYTREHVGTVPGQYVLVALSDTGMGMTTEVMAKAFEPFYSTKQVGQGTGLGLSMVYGFVKQSGGHVKIYSERGQGTTVKLYLPRHTGDVALATARSEDQPPLRSHGAETILIVEDEAGVRRFSADALAELGYRVIEAENADAALRALDSNPEIVLLFTDVIMPGINGRKLADEALRRRPGLKVIFTTGYTRNAIVHNGMLDAGVHLIGKPFTIDQLARKLAEVLDDPVSGSA